MQVNVFVSGTKLNGTRTHLLILPFGPEPAVPKHLQHIKWHYFATTDAGDSTIGATQQQVKAALAEDGFLLTEPGSI